MAVTVIIPNYNNAPFIAQCVGSVADDRAVRSVILYDNASTDGSLAIVEQLDHPKIEIIRDTANIGAARARHRAVAACHTDYVAFLDGDDFLAPDTISAGYAACIAHALDLAVPAMVRVDLEGRFLSTFVPRPDRIMDGRAAFLQTVAGWNIHPMGVIRRETYAKASRDFQFHGFSDDELLTRHLLLAADRVGGCSGAYNYRVVDKTTTAAKRIGQLRTDMRVLALASQLGFGEREADFRKQRNGLARALFGLWRRTFTGGSDAGSVRSLLGEFDRIALPWHLADMPYRMALLAVQAGMRGPRRKELSGND